MKTKIFIFTLYSITLIALSIAVCHRFKSENEINVVKEERSGMLLPNPISMSEPSPAALILQHEIEMNQRRPDLQKEIADLRERIDRIEQKAFEKERSK